MKKFFGFGSNTPPPPPTPPLRPAAKPAPPAAKPLAPTIVGRWKEPSGSDTTEFRADGSVIEKPAGGETIRGRYSLEGTKLKIKLEGLAEELSFKAVLKPEALEMTEPDGKVITYRRA